MGCATSIETSRLETSNPSSHRDDALKGNFVVVCGKSIKLDRDIRVTLKFRATGWAYNGKYSTISGELEKEFRGETILWEAGGVVAKRGTVLEPGENRLAFDFSLDGKLAKVDEYYRPKEYDGSGSTLVVYDYVLRAGSLQVKEFTFYPRLLPEGTNKRVHVVNKETLGPHHTANVVKSIVGATTFVDNMEVKAAGETGLLLQTIQPGANIIKATSGAHKVAGLKATPQRSAAAPPHLRGVPAHLRNGPTSLPQMRPKTNNNKTAPHLRNTAPSATLQMRPKAK